MYWGFGFRLGVLLVLGKKEEGGGLRGEVGDSGIYFLHSNSLRRMQYLPMEIGELDCISIYNTKRAYTSSC